MYFLYYDTAQVFSQNLRILACDTEGGDLAPYEMSYLSCFSKLKVNSLTE